MDLSCSGFFLMGWVFSETPKTPSMIQKGCQAPGKSSAKGARQDGSRTGHCRGGRVTVGTCALVGLGALVLGDARTASLTPGAGSATGFGWGRGTGGC